MSKVFTRICAALSIEALNMKDGAASLTDAQLSSLEQAMEVLHASNAEKEAEISNLKAEIENLKKEPAEPTKSVVDDGGSKPEPNAVQCFVDTVSSARNLFNSLP